MKTIILASNNKGKIKEIREIFSDCDVLSLEDIGFNEEIEENGTTFLENAMIKATTISKFLKEKGVEASVMADDSGLCVDALGGAPGVYSARYAGNHDDAANRKKLLSELAGKESRNAHFVCAFVEVFPNGKVLQVEGKTYGKILTEEIGSNGFGFDSVFFSDDLQKSFGLATSEEKNSVSHRGRAIRQLQELRKKFVD